VINITTRTTIVSNLQLDDNGVFDLCTFAAKCQNATANALRKASLTCEATGITAGVDVSIEWFRKSHLDPVEEDENHQFESEKHKGTLTIVEVGVYLFVCFSVSLCIDLCMV